MAGVVGAAELVAELAAAAGRVELLLPVVVEKAAVDMVALVQQNASGRPGPNAPTGDYRGSWEPERVEDGDPTTTSWSAGTDRAQARRLEYGFTGTDSAGRHYDQPPYEHMGPAADVIEPVFHAAVEAVAAKAVRW